MLSRLTLHLRGSGEGSGQRLASFAGHSGKAEEFLSDLLKEMQVGVLLSSAHGHQVEAVRYGEPADLCVNEAGRLAVLGLHSGKAQLGFGIRRS